MKNNYLTNTTGLFQRRWSATSNAVHKNILIWWLLWWHSKSLVQRMVHGICVPLNAFWVFGLKAQAKLLNFVLSSQQDQPFKWTTNIKITHCGVLIIVIQIRWTFIPLYTWTQTNSVLIFQWSNKYQARNGSGPNAPQLVFVKQPLQPAIPKAVAKKRGTSTFDCR